jgi:hypothetical protein
MKISVLTGILGNSFRWSYCDAIGAKTEHTPSLVFGEQPWPALIQHCVEPVTACQHMRAITERNNPTWIFRCYRPVEFVRNGQIVLALKYPFDPGIFPARAA